MEFRASKRTPVELSVALVRNGKVVATAQTVDMSSNGIGICNTDIELKKGQRLGVVFSRPGFPRGVSCCVKAQVVHCARQATGLYFDEKPFSRSSIKCLL